MSSLFNFNFDIALDLNSWDFDDLVHEVEQFKLIEEQEHDFQTEEGRQRLKDMVDCGRYKMFNNDNCKFFKIICR